MTNVEEHIKQSLMQEVTSSASPFKSIKIDPETMDVKRLLDHDILKTASFMREIDVSKWIEFVNHDFHVISFVSFATPLHSTNNRTRHPNRHT